jgi:tetratricopeptide (TPR) repeat protein
MVDYVEWLPERDGHATYRFPMASEIESPMVGGLSVRVNSKASARWLSASTGAVVTNGGIELRHADVRPTGDLAIEMVPGVVKAGVARAYVAQGEPNEDPYVLVRTEAPELAESGVTLALVVDTSMSVGPSLLETERAVVDALLEALGPKDSIVVLAADQGTAFVGPKAPTPVTPELRAQVRKDIAQVHAGGASNVGAALEQAADLLDAQDKEHAGTGMVVYVGDGRPTVGETSARDLRKRLARRSGGVPRLGAIAVGQGADRWTLAELVDGGPMYDVLDRPEAARAGSAVVADALSPAIRDVSIALGATIDRVYPREARTLPAGGTITVAGRLRGALPPDIGLRFRRGVTLVEERRPLEVVALPAGADVAKRWAEARIQEIVSHGEGIEPAVALATRSRLLTPWTSWFFGGNTSASWDDRILALSPSIDTAYAGKVDPAPQPPSILLEPPKVFDGEASLEDAVEIAARHSLREQMSALVACRDVRAAVRPGVSGNLQVEITVSGDGHATKVAVRNPDQDEDDAILDRCARVVVTAVPFFAAGVTVTFTDTLYLPPAQTLKRSECSTASTVPLAVRRGIWRARKAKGQLDYFSAAHGCELPTWTERRAVLSILAADVNIASGTDLAKRLSDAGETDAAAFVRQELLRRSDLGTLGFDQLRRLVIEDEPKIDFALDKAYRGAKSDDARLAVLRRFLRLAPHSPLGRRLLLSLLETSGDKAGLLEEIDHIRNDSFADAGLLAECASALRRLGLTDEGRRAFGELVERAPRDPWTLAYVGDRLRAEGLYEDALASYERLNEAMPEDPAVALRLALAHAGAGRLDVATRLLDRAAQTGGRGDDGRLGELSSIVSASLLATARSSKPAPDTDALLVRRLAQTPLPDVQSVILVRTPLTDDPVQVSYARQEKDKDELPADLDASSMGLAAVRIERGSGVARIHLKRSAALAGGRPMRGTVTALVLASDRSQSKIVTREVDVAPGEQGIALRWDGETLQ